MNVRIERVNGELQRQIAKVIANDIKDPRLQGAIVSVTNVHTTPDLKYAKVHLSVYAETDEKKREAFDTVVRSAAYIRNKVKTSVQIRLMPELHFVIDNSCDYGMHIDKILSTMVIPPAEEDTEIN